MPPRPQPAPETGRLAGNLSAVLRCGGFLLPLDRTLLMGVVNVTPDSFSDGGQFLDAQAAITRGRRLLEEGADILDIGGATGHRLVSRAVRDDSGGVWGSGPNAPASSRSDSSVPSDSIQARSITFFSSRTLPSQRAVSSVRSAFGVRP